MLIREETFLYLTMSRLILGPTKRSTYLALGGAKHETDQLPKFKSNDSPLSNY